MNRFLYAEANPATMIDPTGHGTDCSPYEPSCTSAERTADIRRTVSQTHPSTGSGSGGSGSNSTPGVDHESTPPTVSTETISASMPPGGYTVPGWAGSCGTSMSATQKWTCAQQLLRHTGLYQWGHGCGDRDDSCAALEDEIVFLLEMAENHRTSLWQELVTRAESRKRDAFWYYMDPYVQEAMLLGVAGASGLGGDSPVGRYLDAGITDLSALETAETAALRFGETDLVYGPSANGALRGLQESAGGRTLNDLAKPTDMTWEDFSVSTLNNAASTGTRVRFDLTHVNDIDGVLRGVGPHAQTVTGAELRHIQANWDVFKQVVTFYNGGAEVLPPW
jgi:hypothetical protein